ncbi:TerB family tellurite resistance protein [Methylorubrum thiocyanatum]|uniref:tellurite resistance TerB family protein n=1 Tax=Methylorubrum thiocyanatum TaxID=47958 RepID=UPI0035C86227
MPVLIIFTAVVASVLFWLLRAHYTVKQLKEIDQDTKGLQRRAKSAFESIVGSPLQRVNDVRLAAVILMIQIVRTGSPITASEKTRILEFMENPLEIQTISATFERAWRYTQERRPFSLVADPLLPLFREKLTGEERVQFVDMLTQVASAHSAPSELQREALVRLKRRLIAGKPELAASRAGHFG